MKEFKLLTNSGEAFAEKVRFANTFWSRFIGLMFTRDLGENDGVLFFPCNSIHTLFMRYPLDLIFLDRKNKVVKIIRNMKPWRMTRPYFKSVKVLEFCGGYVPRDVREGDTIEVICLN